MEYKVSTLKSDSHYRDYFEQKDITEMEKRIKECLAYVIEEKAAEGEELSYADKEFVKR